MLNSCKQLQDLNHFYWFRSFGLLCNRKRLLFAVKWSCFESYIAVDVDLFLNETKVSTGALRVKMEVTLEFVLSLNMDKLFQQETRKFIARSIMQDMVLDNTRLCSTLMVSQWCHTETYWINLIHLIGSNDAKLGKKTYILHVYLWSTQELFWLSSIACYVQICRRSLNYWLTHGNSSQNNAVCDHWDRTTNVSTSHLKSSPQ